MIRIEDTKNMIGITIHGDYNDLKTLHTALSDFLRFYFDHQKPNTNSAYEIILGLCYDIRHAFQGDRNIEYVGNNHEYINMPTGCGYQPNQKSIQKERNRSKNGNLYFNVEVLYPWAIYYLYVLQAITEDLYRHSWFEDDEYGYTEYQAEHDLNLIRLFVQMLWGKLQKHLPDDVMKTVWEYSRCYTHTDYYFYYSYAYMQWLCIYWVRGVKTREERKKLLPLVCLELSSILDEDEDEQMEILSSAEEKKKELSSVDSGTSEQTSGLAESIRAMEISIAKNTLNGLALYDKYYELFSEYPIPYKSLFDFDDCFFDYTDEHSPFTEERFEQWMVSIFGSFSWDITEW